MKKQIIINVKKTIIYILEYVITLVPHTHLKMKTFVRTVRKVAKLVVDLRQIIVKNILK